ALRYVGRLLSRTAVRAVPAVGWVAGAASAFGSTFALGLVAIRYFRPEGDRDGVAPVPAHPEGVEREAPALRLEWESGAISEETYRQDLEALRERLGSGEGDSP
ncbi:MAG: hypothetical protein ACE5IM_10085, partial [Nitrospinota bacterium]